MTNITVTHENHRIENFAFDPSKKIISLGRRKNNDVCIPDLSVSGNHAIITVNGDELILEDLKSTNGSYVNGEFVERAKVSGNTEIILGKILIEVNAIEAPAANSFSNDRPGLAQRAAVTPTPEPAAAMPSNNIDTESTLHEFVDAGGAAERPEHVEALLEPTPIMDAMPKPTQGRADEHPLNGVEHLVAPESSHGGVEAMNEAGSTPAKQARVAAIEIKNGVKSGQKLPIDKPVTTLGRPGIQIAAIMRKPDGYFLMHIESDQGVDRPVLNDDAIGDEPVSLSNGDAFTIAGIEVQFMLS